MPFTKGIISWNKGLTKETSQKLATSAQKISQKNKGHHYSPSTEFKNGLIPWNKGLTKKSSPIVAKYATKLKGKHHSAHSEEWRKRHREWMTGENNPNARWMKLSEEEARKIFEDYKQSGLNIRAFAKKARGSEEALINLFKRHFPDEYVTLIEEKQCRKATMYQRGRAFEYRVRDIFMKDGYFVLRSPRSKGPVDLVAMKKGEILLVQCKLGQNYLSKKERRVLVELANSLGAKPLLVHRESHEAKIIDLGAED